MAGEVLQFAGSLAAVAVLVAFTYFLGFRHSPQIDSTEEARDLFRLAPRGFEPVEIALDGEGRAAIGKDRDGRLAVLVPHGSQFVVRPVSPGAKVAARNGALVIEGLPRVPLHLGDGAEDWAATDSDANTS